MTTIPIVIAILVTFYVIIYMFVDNIHDRDEATTNNNRMNFERERLLSGAAGGDKDTTITMNDTNIVTVPLPPPGYDIQSEYARFMNGGPINGTVTESVYANPKDKTSQPPAAC